MTLRGLSRRYDNIEFTFMELDYNRLNKWLSLCGELEKRSEKKSERAVLEGVKDFLLDINFFSDSPYVPSENRMVICAEYDMRDFDEKKKALLNDVLYYTAFLGKDIRLSVKEKKTAAAMYDFLELSLYTKAMDAFIEVDERDRPVEYEEGEEYTRIKKQKTPEELAREKATEEKLYLDAEISF